MITAHPYLLPRWEYKSTAVGQALTDGIEVNKSVRPERPTKERIVTALVNIDTGLELGIYKSGVDEGLAALLERVFYVKSAEHKGWIRPPAPHGDYLSEVFKQMKRDLDIHPVHEIGVEEFLSRYKGAKLSAYRKAADELRVFGFEAKKHTLIVAFVKDERQKRGKAPRLIRPMSITFNLMFGCYIYPLEKAIYHGIDDLYGCPTVTKGLNGLEVADALLRKWRMFADPVCIITDCERFDQHCSVESLREAKLVCIAFLKKGGGNVDEFNRLWEMTIKTRGIVVCDDGIVRYKVAGTLNSGLSSTSLCGVLIVCTLLRYVCKSASVEHQLISAGDDTNIILERKDLSKVLPLLKPIALRCGFTLKVDGVVDVFEQISFCQCKPVYDGNTWVMVRDPFVSIPKDLLTSKKFARPLDRLAYMRAVADCGIALTGGIPVVQSFYCMYRRAAGDVDPAVLERNGFYHLARNMQRGVCPISDEARLSFYRAFGITEETQLVLERAFDHVTIEDMSGFESSLTKFDQINFSNLL